MFAKSKNVITFVMSVAKQMDCKSHGKDNKNLNNYNQ